MHLILIRHAEAQSNVQKIIAGPKGCRGLTERGQQQARGLARRLQATGEVSQAQVFLSSPVLRVHQTAQLLAEAVPLPPLQLDEDLWELFPGEADGLTQAEYDARFGRFDLMQHRDRPYSPGGESWNGFYNRVDAWLQRMAAQHAGKTVVAVTHAGNIVISFLALFGVARPGTGAFFDPDHTSITEWEASGGRWRLARLNDASHLHYRFDR